MKSDPFADLYSLADAAARWKRADATLRQAIQRGKLVAGVDVKLFGKQWVVTESAMRREYGQPPDEKAPE
ncbi:MAG: helix-turn-helix domain-containing protein [Bacillota bacterium]